MQNILLVKNRPSKDTLKLIQDIAKTNVHNLMLSKVDKSSSALQNQFNLI